MGRMKEVLKKAPGARKVVHFVRKVRGDSFRALCEREVSLLSTQVRLLRSNAQSIALAVAEMERERRSGAHPPPEIGSAEQLPNLKSTSRLCTQREFMTSEYLYWCKRIKEAPLWHRKQWEYYFIAQALWEKGMLTSGRRGCGFGVGQEPLPTLFATFGCKIVGTDAPANEEIEKHWNNTGQYAASLDALNLRGIAPKETFLANVTYRPVDMNQIPADLNDFDFVWSTCALEHLGGLEQGSRFLLNSCRCLKPGGVGVHTTECNISSDEKTVDRGPVVLFRKKDIMEMAARLMEIGCELLPVDFAVASQSWWKLDGRKIGVSLS